MKTYRLFLGALGALLAAHVLVIGVCWFRPGATAPVAAAPHPPLVPEEEPAYSPQ